MTKSIKYYGGMFYSIRDRGRERLTSVFRWVTGDGFTRTERWDGKEWVHSEEAARVMGTGGVSGMKRLTKKQVDDFIRGKKGGEGSGHHDHTGLPGTWGGSSPTGRAEPAKKPTAKKPPEKTPAEKPAVDQEMLDALWNTDLTEISPGALEDTGLSEDDMKEMFALPGARTSIKVYLEKGTVEIIWRDTDSGDLIGTATREFYSARRVCKNKDLFIEDKYQDLDFAQSLYDRQKEILFALGYDKIELYANVSIGKYAWAKQGFEYVFPGDGKDHRESLEAWMVRIGLDSEVEKYGKKIDKFTKPSDFANFDIPGLKIKGRQINNYDVNSNYEMHIGKAYMLDAMGHGSWDAVYYLRR